MFIPVLKQWSNSLTAEFLEESPLMYPTVFHPLKAVPDPLQERSTSKHMRLARGTTQKLCRVVAFLVSLFCGLSGVSFAAKLTDPAVDPYNVRVGTQTFAGLYQFTTNNLLIETAQAITNMGSDTIKMYLGANYARQYHTNLSSSITNLLTLARNEPNCRTVLDMPFRRIIAWAYPLSNPDAPFQNANYTATQQANDYREMYDLTHYLLTNYNNSGKTFYLGHWEGDGYLNVNNWTTNPSPTTVSNMVIWENTRQKGVDDARSTTTFSNVNVFYYLEVNRVRDAMINGSGNNVRVADAVLPYVTNIDFVSYSSYDAMNLDTNNLYTTLHYIETNTPPVPESKASFVPAQRLWIGEYGWGGSQSPAQQEPTSRTYMQRLLNYSNALPFILFWEMYDNETNADGSFKNFDLIDSTNTKVPCYYLHQRFINSARLATARFKETNGRLPVDAEFASLVSPMLNNPLPAPVNLTVANGSAAVQTNASARVSGSLTQGVYGDDQAAVWVFFGRQDGGMTRAAWEQSQKIGVNTNFNPTTFTALVTNLAPGTNYFYRFYATNASGEAWAPTSAQLSTAIINPADFGSRMQIAFSGYNRGEVLTNFPVLVNLSTNLPGFSYRQFASGAGGDLRFTDASGLVPVPHEVDEWNTNGVSTVWVSVPQLSGTNDFIWAYWGNPAATVPPVYTTNGTVWWPNYYVVYHLKESGFPYTDSAGQHPALAGVAPASTAGQIGRGASFNGSSQFLDAGTINLGSEFTLSAWMNFALTATNIQTMWANQKGGYGSPGFAFFVDTYNTRDQKLDFASGDGTNGNESTTAGNAVSFGQWHLLTASVSRTNGTVEFFVDGNDLGGSSSVVTGLANQADVNLGRFTNADFYFKGVMDEARIAAGTRSSNWVWASWATVAANTSLESYSAVVQQLPALLFSLSSGGGMLSWPAYGVGFALYTTTNLSPPVTWTPATNQPVLVSNQWQVALPALSEPSRFYRLQQ